MFHFPTLPLLTPNAPHIAEVAASKHFFREQRRESSKFCPREIMPQFWQYARYMPYFQVFN
jgi:hypothetical protein